MLEDVAVERTAAEINGGKGLKTGALGCPDFVKWTIDKDKTGKIILQLWPIVEEESKGSKLATKGYWAFFWNEEQQGFCHQGTKLGWILRPIKKK